MWVRKFSRDRGSIDEAEAAENQAEAEARQSENHVNVLNLIHDATYTPNTFSLYLKTLFYT